MVDTVRQNKPELPAALVTTKGRWVFSSKFAFSEDTTIVSCMENEKTEKQSLITIPTKEEWTTLTK